MKKLLFLFAILFVQAVSAGEKPTHTALFQLFAEDAQPVIGQALAEQGAGDKIAATIYGHDALEPMLSHNKPIEVEIHGLRFDERSKRWNANLMAVSGNAVVTAMPISGRYQEMISLPVLKRQLRRGDTISEDDIEVQDFPITRIRGEVVTQAEALLGQSPVRSLSPDRPIRTHEVAGPVLVKKESLVKVQYIIPGMEITSNGQALEDGSEGSIIAVRNMDSKKVVHAIVKDTGVVSIPNRHTTAQTQNRKGLNYANN